MREQSKRKRIKSMWNAVVHVSTRIFFFFFGVTRLEEIVCSYPVSRQLKDCFVSRMCKSKFWGIPSSSFERVVSFLKTDLNASKMCTSFLIVCILYKFLHIQTVAEGEYFCHSSSSSIPVGVGSDSCIEVLEEIERRVCKVKRF